MLRDSRRALVLGALVLLGALAAAQGGSFTNADVPRDDQKGRYLNFERAQLAPFVLSADGSRLYVLNSPGARLAVFDTQSNTRLYEVAIGLGAVSIARRPDTEELWIVDSLASSVLVVDPAKANIKRTIRVGAAPHGIAFTDSGDRAYVTCSAAERVDVLASASYALVKSIPIPARDPRAIVWQDGQAWVLSFTSGNNTAPAGTLAEPGRVLSVKKVTGPGVQPLPDRDLFAITTKPDPLLDSLDPGQTRTGLGTTLFNLCPRPGTSELWIPNTDALNAEHKGEKNFVAGQVVSNRITIVDAQGAQPPQIVDLDLLAPPGQRCAQPTSVAFDPSGERAYVTGFGSDLVAVLDLAGGQPVWAGVVTLPAKQSYPRGTGPRASLLHPNGTQLYVFERVDNSLSAIDLAALPAGGSFTLQANIPWTLGFEGTTDEERFGRHLFTHAGFSKSGTSSCASCHIDGHTDGLAWDLSGYLDPEGTPDDQLAFGVDVKGPLVTQSTRCMQDQGPFHWRGEKRGINDFQVAFKNLLENQVGGQAAEIGPDFQYLRHYINRLRYPPNPRAALDRLYTPAQLAGAELFMTKPVLGGLTCASCHQLPLGTGGDLVTEVADGILTSADVPALRGVGDRLAPAFAVGGEFGRRTELGAGLTHGGGIASFRDAILRIDGQTGQPQFNLTQSEADQITAFLLAFDSGLAPAAAYVATAHAGNAANFAATELAFLEDQVARGNCDLVYYRSPRILPFGTPMILTGRYDPATGQYRPASKLGAPASASFLMAEAANGRPVTFVGVPLGMGLTMGLDRDCDGLWDFDEQRKGTNAESWDTDGDGYPDGYEVDWSMDPLVVDSSTPDTQAPALAGPVRLVWASTNTLKFEFDTTEMTKVWLSYNGGYVVQRLPLGPPAYDTHHDVVLDGLDPNTAIQLELNLKDPSGNATLDTSAVFSTRARVLGDPAAVDQIGLSIVQGVPVNLLQADVALVRGSQPAGAGYLVQGAVYQVLFGGGLALVTGSVQAASGSNGVATFYVPLPAQPAPPGTLVFVVKDVAAPAGSAPYALALNRLSNAAIGY